MLRRSAEALSQLALLARAPASEAASLDLAQLLAGLECLLRPLAESAGVELELRRPAGPVRVRAPARLDFSMNAHSESFAELSPLLGQTFFIGDGTTPSGLQQRFVIPAGATRFYLGFADAFSFQGPPGAYADNTGGLSVTLTQAR